MAQLLIVLVQIKIACGAKKKKLIINKNLFHEEQFTGDMHCVSYWGEAYCGSKMK